MTVPAPVASPPTRSSPNTRVLGGLLLVFGSSWMLKQAGVIDVPWSAVFSLVLIALGAALIITSRRKVRTIPLILLGAALTAGLAVGSADLGVRGGFGQRTLQGANVLEATRSFRLGVGELDLDLTKVDVPADKTTVVHAQVSIGHLLVKVPRDVGLKVDVDAKLGNAVVLGHQLDVHGKATDAFETEGYDKAAQKLHLILRVGAGQIDVEH